MKNRWLPGLRSLWANAGSWYESTPERALNQAYEAALAIRALEDRYFEGNPIDLDSTRYGDSTCDYFRTELQKQLKMIDVRLWEFNSSNAFLDFGTKMIGIPGRKTEAGLSNPNAPIATSTDASGRRFSEPGDRSFIVLKKLELIDNTLDRYVHGRSVDRLELNSDNLPATPEESPPVTTTTTTAALDQSRSWQAAANAAKIRPKRPSSWRTGALNVATRNISGGMRKPSATGSTGLIPRSLLTTFDRVRRDLDDRSEEEVLQNYRTSKVRTIVSLKFILLLILVPLLVQQMSKNFLVGPIVDRVYHPSINNVFLNMDMQEEALVELERYENFLHFQSLLGKTPKLTPEEIEEKVQEKAEEIANESWVRSADALKNVFSDFLSLAGFGLVIAYSREEIAVLKSFIDEIMYGLSDSAKAFVIILSTDIFVGYHSAHGWEVVVSGISRHLGLPENKDFMFLFIATFPVILDAVIKYWIFRYLNRISPSAVATYKDMNE
ncbi:proton extrusion protein PcxA [Limnothrix sp. FACHB-1083]|nr:proton extrusion protein PcxA [Limnothrix sp. FACHB-1083]MBD2161322.1 proton extrusion protein PcxA [Limnothrix sp. FACHB-1083]MBD2192166.1 proton extrusion protein PcxA [Limnothrix sp. FACHB-1088]